MTPKTHKTKIKNKCPSELMLKKEIFRHIRLAKSNLQTILKTKLSYICPQKNQRRSAVMK